MGLSHGLKIARQLSIFASQRSAGLSSPITPNTQIKNRAANAALFFMGWVMGLEPTTLGTTIRCSAIELHPPYSILNQPASALPKKLARQKGLEPLTYCLEGSCSIQLSYWRILDGAGDGNRTRVSSLEGWCSTIELHPQVPTD